MSIDTHLFDYIKAAALLGGNMILEALGTKNQLPADQKSSHADIITETDLMVDSRIRDFLTKLCPRIQINSEESTENRQNEELIIVDPIDGTLNYSHGINEIAVSIGYWRADTPIIGVVYNPIQNLLYSAQKGKGAFRNGIPIRVSDTESIRKSMLSSGWPYDKAAVVDAGLLMGKMTLECQEVRVLGSAALAVCKVADGSLDGYWEAGLFPWDLAGAVVVLNEAGGVYSSYDGSDFKLASGEIIATNGVIHHEVVDKLKNEGLN